LAKEREWRGEVSRCPNNLWQAVLEAPGVESYLTNTPKFMNDKMCGKITFVPAIIRLKHLK
jgi:hypothetical protein